MQVGDLVTMASPSRDLPKGIILEMRGVQNKTAAWCTVMWYDGSIENLGEWEIKAVNESR
jgi:hypothetical protein